MITSVGSELNRTLKEISENLDLRLQHIRNMYIVTFINAAIAAGSAAAAYFSGGILAGFSKYVVDAARSHSVLQA